MIYWVLLAAFCIWFFGLERLSIYWMNKYDKDYDK